jgi:hypothetical protein
VIHRLVSSIAAVMLTTVSVAAQTLTFTQVGSIAGPADLIEVQGRTAYVAAGKTLTIVDVTDPAAPRRAASYTFPELIWGVTVSGTRVYVAADTYGLGILDVSDIAAPKLIGALKTPGQAKNVAIFKQNRALVADHIRGINLVDISVPEKPALLTSFFVDGFAKDVVVGPGNFAYALDQPAGLNIFDLSSPSAFAPVGMTTLANPIPLRAQLDVSESSGPLGAEARSAKATRQRLAVVAGGGPVQIFDVSETKAPKQATVYRTPGAAQRVVLQGVRLYVADGPAGLQVLDLTTPSTPTIIGAHKTQMGARDVAVADALVFVVVGGEQVLILRQSGM